MIVLSLARKGQGMRKALFLCLLLMLMTAGSSMAAPAPIGCSGPDCLCPAGQGAQQTVFSDPKVIYGDQHYCSVCANTEAAVCQALNVAMMPRWDRVQDLLSVPHRGFWGQLILQHGNQSPPAENTKNAIMFAQGQGYHIVEIDVAFTAPQSVGGAPKVILGHYFSEKAYTVAAGSADSVANPHDTIPASVGDFYMRQRDQSPSEDLLDRVFFLEDAIAYAKQTGMILMVDPKSPATQDDQKNEELRLMAHAVYLAYSHGALANIVIKTRHSASDSLTAIQNYLSRDFSVSSSQFLNSMRGRFLWSPITPEKKLPNESDQMLRDRALTYVDEWHTASDASRHVLVYETNLLSEDFILAKPFVWDGVSIGGAKHYSNLLDYVRLLPGYGKRSALWSVDPMGNKGTLGRLYNWKFIGNTASDKRGNPITTLSHDHARHSLITTDRPNQYQSLVTGEAIRSDISPPYIYLRR